MCEAACSRPGARGSASPRTRATSRATRRSKALDGVRRRAARTRAARSSRRSRRENRVAILMLGRPYHYDPGLNHGSSRSSRCSATRSCRCARSRRTATWLDRYFEEDIAERRDRRRRSTSPTCGRRTTRPTGAEGVGARSSPRATRTSRARPVELQVRPRRADLRPHRLDHRRSRRRPTRRCTTSTPTSRAARSRSASRPTPTR